MEKRKYRPPIPQWSDDELIRTYYRDKVCRKTLRRVTKELKNRSPEVQQRAQEAKKRRNAASTKKYLSTTRGKLKAKQYGKRQSRTNPLFKLRRSVRTRVYAGLKLFLLEKKEHSVDLLGCSFPDYAEYLESHFQPGMSWENHGEWHIDHTVPVAPILESFGEDAAYIAFNYRNTRPMWAFDNHSKNDSLDKVDPESLDPWVCRELKSLYARLAS